MRCLLIVVFLSCIPVLAAEGGRFERYSTHSEPDLSQGDLRAPVNVQIRYLENGTWLHTDVELRPSVGSVRHLGDWWLRVTYGPRAEVEVEFYVKAPEGEGLSRQVDFSERKISCNWDLVGLPEKLLARNGSGILNQQGQTLFARNVFDRRQVVEVTLLSQALKSR